jgi:cytochrome c-type biogenesis protein
MSDISFILAFSAGLVSFLSPCVLPLVPAYVSYLTGVSIKDMGAKNSKLTTLYKSLGFVVGFSIIFVIMGASITSLGKIFIKNQNIFRVISGLLIFLFGIHMTGLFKFRFMSKETKFFTYKNSKGTLGSIFIGMAFAAGWTPCVGPILSSILLYASSMDTVQQGILLLTFYSLGLAVPFILTALAVETLSKKIRNLTKYLKVISIISGILMIIMGILIFTNKVGILSQYLNFINI